jgi:hypothetical protein
MLPHHERAVRKLAEHFEQDETCMAVIVGGSIAKGIERDDSDVDVMLLVTDEVYERQWERGQLFYLTGEFCDYPGGYIDGKYVNRAYLEAAAERGNEVTRAAFKGAFVAHAKTEGIEALIERIAAYQPAERAEKIAAFFAQFQCAMWYATEGLRRDDRYLLTHAVSEMARYAGRLILAHNEILYPYHKHLMSAVAGAEDKPDGLLQMIDALLEAPDGDRIGALYRAIVGFRPWSETGEMWQTRYLKDTELAWLEGREYVGDR